jgi:hypothetical protein
MSIKSFRVLVLLSFSACLIFTACKSKEEKQAEAIEKELINATKQVEAEGGIAEIMSDAPKTLIAFEASVLAAIAESGENFPKGELVFKDKETANWSYVVSDDGKTCTATAKNDIEAFKKGGTLVSKYDSGKGGFIHSSDQADAAQKLIPDFFAN